jgi:hypothetical protein
MAAAGGARRRGDGGGGGSGGAGKRGARPSTAVAERARARSAAPTPGPPTRLAHPSPPPYLAHPLARRRQELRKIVEDCWAPDPEARPTFEGVIQRLEALLKTMPKHVPYTSADDKCCSIQ